MLCATILTMQVCEGRGIVRATGNRKKNMVQLDRIVKSRWTSTEIREGHRHYVCTEKRGSKKKQNLELRMSNSCGPEEQRVHLWVSLDEVKQKSIWRQGWVTLEDIRIADRGALVDAKICFLCKGTKVVTCDECGGTGKVGTQQVLYD